MAELSLFLLSFLAATIVPFSSEAAFMVALSEGMATSHAMVAASSGNVLAIIFNYALGYFLSFKTQKKLSLSRVGRKAYDYGHKYGIFAMFFSFLPVIGDPLTLVAGVVRISFVWFLLIAGSLRVIRYYFLANLMV